MVPGGRERQRHSWLCPDDARRERAVDMERRLKPVRTVAMGALTLELIATGHWIGWWPVLMCLVVGVGFALADLRLDQHERPEITIAVMWVVTQFTIAGSVWLTDTVNAGAISWLVIPMVTLPARFDLRVVIAGAILTAGLIVAVTVGPHPGVLTEAPQDVLAPLALLVAMTTLTTALMWSDIHHRTESVIDGLTGMLNRRALSTRLNELAGQAQITGEPIGVIIGDLDRFKRINDELGHAVGDTVLVDVAYTLRKELRAFDLAYRLGGEEFLVVLPGASLEEATEVAERLRGAVAATPAGGQKITMSFGVASSGGGAFEHEELLRSADEALYEAKRDGRDRVATAGRPLHAVLAA